MADLNEVGNLLAKSPHYAAKVQARIDDVGDIAQYATYALRPFEEAGLYFHGPYSNAEVARFIMQTAPNPLDVDTTEP